jgi:hypothetical protein
MLLAEVGRPHSQPSGQVSETDDHDGEHEAGDATESFGWWLGRWVAVPVEAHQLTSSDEYDDDEQEYHQAAEATECVGWSHGEITHDEISYCVVMIWPFAPMIMWQLGFLPHASAIWRFSSMTCNFTQAELL